MGVFDITGKTMIPCGFRVCGLNVGNFANGESGDPAGTDTMYNNFLETFRKCNANVYMFSEWDKFWDSSRTITSESVLGFLKPYRASYITDEAGGYAGQMTYSDFPIKSEYHKVFTDHGGGNYFLHNKMDVYGRDVHFICTHFTWKTQELRDSQIREILNYIDDNNLEYYVVAGDFNLGLHGQDSRPQTQELKFEIARQDVDLLESYGAISAQGGVWGLKDRDGFFNTAGHGGWNAANTNMFDNIVISPTLRFKNVFVATTAATDHDAICADLEII